MAANNKASVFVGNIPFTQTEEQIIKICEEIGPVVSFKFVVDRDTGKPKGYGFCQYRDEETALSACRNLNAVIDGRPLRVGPSNASKAGSAAAAPAPVNYGGLGFVGVPQQKPVAAPVSYGGPGFVGVHPQQQQMGVPNCYVPAPPAPSCYVDPMADYLEKRYTKNQLTEVLSQFQILARHNTDLARQLLSMYPALSSAVYQGLGLISASGNHVRM
ncbi:hypothetical protein ACHQM5_011106 [Ranunculus cassubicifolius]